MEKSMVHELNGLTNSQFVNRSTFITTAYNQGDFQLRKSRIQNLPSYKKQDLSQRLPFVVVFQTIEIERLSTEIEALRIALKDAQRQNFNIHNYQIQIRELTEKCHNYEAERQQYLQQNDRMNIICQKLYQELEDMKTRYANIDPTLKQKYRLQRQRTSQLQEDLEKWRTRYSALQHSKNREMQDLRMMMESQRKSMIDRQIKQITIKFNSERSNLENQIRKLREIISMKDGELDRLNSKISQLQILNQQMRHYEETMNEYQNKFAMISQEAIRLNEVLRNKQEQNQRLLARQEQLKRKIIFLERKLEEQKQGGEKVREMEGYVRQWQAKYSRLQNQKRKSDQQLGKIPQFQIMIKQISQEAERMKDTVKQKMRDNDEWKFRYQKLSNELRETKSQQQHQIPRLENRINQINNQNTRINEILKTRTGDLENWKNKYGELERQVQKIHIIQQEKCDLSNQLDQQVRSNNNLQNINRQLQGKMRQFDQLGRAYQQQKQSKDQCIRQIDRLNDNIRNISNRSEEMSRKCQNLQKQMQSYVSMEQEIQVYKKKQINLTREIDRINGIINEKVQQIQSLKETFRKLQHSINQYQGMEQKMMNTVSQMQKLMQDLDQSRKQTGFLQQKLMIADSQNKKSKNQLYILTQEKQQAVKLYNTKSRQYQNLMSESEQLRGQLNVLKQRQARGRQFQDKYRTAQAKIQQIQRRLNKQRLRSEQLNSQLEKASGQLSKIKKQGAFSAQFKQQFMQVKYQCQQKQRQIRNMVTRINQLQNIIKRLKDSTVRNDQINKRNHQKWTNIDKQIDTALKMIQKTLQMQNQIYKLNEENMKLQGKVKLLTVELDCQNMKKSTYGSSSRMSSQASISGLAPIYNEPLGFKNDSFNGYNVTVSRSNFRTQGSNSSFPFRQTRDII